MGSKTPPEVASTRLTPHVLVVDDEPAIRQLLQQYLQSQGFRISAVADAASARVLLEHDLVDLVLLDVGLPGEDGLSLTRFLREHWQGAVIIISGRGDPIERVVGLEVGADDYVAKPFELRELLARVRSVLRRTQASSPAPGSNGRRTSLRFNGLRLDVQARELTETDGRPIALTSGEFELLLALLENANRVLSREQLMQRIHGRASGPYDRAIDVQIARLRQKIEPDPARPSLIKSVRSVGYVLTATVARS